MRIRVVLVEPEYEGNIGSIARSMKNFGLRELYLVKPRVSLGTEAYAYASHSREILDGAIVTRSLDEALEGADLIVGTTAVVGRRPANLLRIPLTPQQFGRHLVGSKRLVGLLFGRESKGLSNRELSLCDVVVTIPSNEAHPVLNVAMAATILFYEIFKAVSACHLTGLPLASRAIRTRLLEVFEGAAVLAGLPSQKRQQAKRAFGNVVSRSFITAREASLITGVLRRSQSRLTSQLV